MRLLALAAVTVALAVPVIGCGDDDGDGGQVQEEALRDCLTEEGLTVEASDLGSSAGLGNATPDFRVMSEQGEIADILVEGSDQKADSQIVLLHFVNGEFTPQPGRETWSPEDFVAYSRVCTHAGCSVAQYADVDQLLLCPCHQSTFDVLNGAVPTSGPASRPLPQLPLSIDDEGVLYAQSDFTEPIGPGFWNA